MVGLKGYSSPYTYLFNIYFSLLIFPTYLLLSLFVIAESFSSLFLLMVHEVCFWISGNTSVALGCSMLGLSNSVCWCNLFAMFANTNSCGTMQPLEYFLPPWVVHMSHCGIRTGCNAYSDRNNRNQTLCFTGSHFRCYVWLDLCIQWALLLSRNKQAQNTEQLFVSQSQEKPLPPKPSQWSGKQCFTSATRAAIVYFSLKSTLGLSGMFRNSTKMLLFWLVNNHKIYSSWCFA